MAKLGRFNTLVTEELLAVIETMTGEEPRGRLVERLLREHPEVEKARKKAGIVWGERNAMGRPSSKEQEVVEPVLFDTLVGSVDGASLSIFPKPRLSKLRAVTVSNPPDDLMQLRLLIGCKIEFTESFVILAGRRLAERNGEFHISLDPKWKSIVRKSAEQTKGGES